MDYCNDTECQYYKQGVCLSVDRHHSTDRFCITGRRKPRNETAELMQPNDGICHRVNGKMKRKR